MSIVYYGAVINPQTLTSYQALPNCLLSISPKGDIDWIVEDVLSSMVQETLIQKGCIDLDVVTLKHGEFIMPGFIDTHTVRPINLIMSTFTNTYRPLTIYSTLVKSRIWGGECWGAR